MLEDGFTIVITGGASGLGLAVAERFLKLGSQVAVLDLPKEGNPEKIQALGPKARFYPTDISDSKQIQISLKTAQEELSTPRALVNCAGIGFAIKTLKKGVPSDLEFFTKTLSVNLTGTFDVSRQTAGLMAKNEPDQNGSRGVIINTASIAAYEGQMGQTAYAASKGGIASMTLPMARDLSSYGIRVMTIAPGIFDTPMFAYLPEEACRSLTAQIPFPKRLGKPDEYAALVQHIIENPMLNGEVIRLDGALRMGIK